MIGTSILSFLPTVAPTLTTPGPYWLFTFLQWLTFVLHLLAMNMLFGGLLLFVFGRNTPFRKQLFDTQIRLFPTVMAATITLGVAPLLFLQVLYGRFFYSATIVSAWNWFLIMPVVIIVYYLLYMVAMNKDLSGSIKQLLLLLAVAGLVYVSYTYTMITDLAEKPGLWAGLYKASPAGTSVSPPSLENISRWAHIISGGTAVAGLMIQLFAVYNKKVKDHRPLLSFGGHAFLMGISTAAFLAIIYLLVIDREILNRFLLSPGLHAILGAIALNIVIAVLVFKSDQSKSPKKLVNFSALLAFLGVFCMVIARHYLRLIYLEGEFDPAAITVNMQWGPLIMFLASFVVGLVVLFWMIRKFFTSAETA